MQASSALVRRLRQQGQVHLSARHPKKIRAAASGLATVAAFSCLMGVLIALAVLVFAGDGWNSQRQRGTALQSVLVPLLLVQIALSGALFLAHQTLPRAAHTFLTGLWLLPLALTVLFVGGAGGSSSETVLFVWGVYGLALTLWVFSHFQRGPLARMLCYFSPLWLFAAWSAAGRGSQGFEPAAFTITTMTGVAIIAVPGVLVARAVAELPRVHRWASALDSGSGARPDHVLWVVGVKVGLLMSYLAFARWRFPLQDFVPGNVRQWGMASVCALFALAPMRLARTRTLDEVRVGRLARFFGVMLTVALALPVSIAMGSAIWQQVHLLGLLAVGLLFVAAVAMSKAPPLVSRRSLAVLLTPLAVLAGYLAPLSQTGAQKSQEFSITWLVSGMLVGGSLVLIVAGLLAWRHGEFWFGARAFVFVTVWIVLVAVLRRTGMGLAGVDIALTVMLLGAAVWLRWHPNSHLDAIEVLALCGLPVILVYGPDLLAGAPAAVRPWFAIMALAAPAAAALWHHIGLARGGMPEGHIAGLALLGALYGMVGASVLMLGITSTEVLSQLPDVLFPFLAVPLSILFIATLKGGSPDVAVGLKAPAPSAR